jgi:hypothetical protein
MSNFIMTLSLRRVGNPAETRNCSCFLPEFRALHGTLFAINGARCILSVNVVCRPFLRSLVTDTV